MNFKTFANASRHENIDFIKFFLQNKIKKAMELSKSNWKLPQIYAAISQSGGSNLGSRYGLKSEILFADTELICAYEKGDGCIDYLIYRFDFKYYPRMREVSAFPLVVAVEASSCCNLRCKMCFQRNMDVYHHEKQNAGIMSEKVYQRFLSELDNQRLYSIVFASRGEPLLNPNIANMIHAAKAKGVMDIKLNTNATLLDERMSRKLLESGLDLIVFSVDSIHPEVYQSIRGYDLSIVMQNIDRFLEIRAKEYPQSKLKTRVAMVVTKDLKDSDREIDGARQYWTERVDEFSVKTENDFVLVYGSESYAIDAEPCGLLWERLYLWYNGEVNPCDIDHFSKLSLGNIMRNDSIHQIWHGDKINMLRQEHEKRCRSSVPCVGCRGY